MLPWICESPTEVDQSIIDKPLEIDYCQLFGALAQHSLACCACRFRYPTKTLNFRCDVLPELLGRAQRRLGAFPRKLFAQIR